MFQLNKIRAHIKLLENQKLKLSMYLQETIARTPKDESRIKDINRSLKRVNDNISQWVTKLEKFESAPADPPARKRTTQDLGGPLIG